MASHDPQTNAAANSDPAPPSRAEKEKLRKKNQAAAKKAAKKLAVANAVVVDDSETTTTGDDEAACKAALAASILSKMTTPANAALASFAASTRQVWDLPDNILRPIWQLILPVGINLQATGKAADDWKLQWFGPRSESWVAELLLVSKKFRTFAARAICSRYQITIFYQLPIGEFMVSEFETAPADRAVIEGGKIFPRYLRENITTLRMTQWQVILLHQMHGITVSAFPRLNKVEVFVSDIAVATKLLAGRIDEDGITTFEGRRFDARPKLRSIQKVYDDNGKDFEALARFWTKAQSIPVPHDWDPVACRAGFDMIVHSTFSSTTTADPTETLQDFCAEVLGIRREAFRGLRQGTELEVQILNDFDPKNKKNEVSEEFLSCSLVDGGLSLTRCACYRLENFSCAMMPLRSGSPTKWCCRATLPGVLHSTCDRWNMLLLLEHSIRNAETE